MTTVVLNPELANLVDIQMPTEEKFIEMLISVDNAEALKEDFYPRIISLLVGRELSITKIVAALMIARLEYARICETRSYKEVIAAHKIDLEKYLRVLISSDILQESAVVIYKSIPAVIFPES